jgi:hypothetical protein
MVHQFFEDGRKDSRVWATPLLNRLDVTAAESFNASAVLVNLALISSSDAQMVETQCWACEGY